MKITVWMIIALSALLAIGCLRGKGDADDSEGAAGIGDLSGEPVGNNNSVYDEIDGDIAMSPFLQEMMEMLGSLSADTDTDTSDTDTEISGDSCGDLADCVCPLAAAAEQQACYDEIDAMTETDCADLYAMYAGTYC